MAHRLPPAGKKTEYDDAFMFYRVVGKDTPSGRGSKSGRQEQKVQEPTCTSRPKFRCMCVNQQSNLPQQYPPPSCRSPCEPSCQPAPPACGGHRLVCWPEPDLPTRCQPKPQQQMKRPSCQPFRPQPRPQCGSGRMQRKPGQEICHCTKQFGNYKVECCCKITEMPRRHC